MNDKEHHRLPFLAGGDNVLETESSAHYPPIDSTFHKLDYWTLSLNIYGTSTYAQNTEFTCPH